MLDSNQVEKYKDDGFVIVEDLIDAATIQKMRAAVDELTEKSRDITEHNETFDLYPDHSRANPRVRRIKSPEKAAPIFDEVMRSPALIKCLQQLLGDNVRFRHSKLNMKEAGTGAPVEWHQDWAFYPHTNGDVLAVGIFLDDCTMDSGPLLIVPGSHKGPIYNHHSDGYFCGAINLEENPIDISNAQPCIGKAGSVSIHHALAVHGSASNVSPDPRRLLLYEYTAADAWPLLGIKSLDEFNSRLVAGEINITPRLTSVPVIMPLPPAPYQGSIYENQTTLKSRFFK